MVEVRSTYLLANFFEYFTHGNFEEFVLENWIINPRHTFVFSILKAIFLNKLAQVKFVTGGILVDKLVIGEDVEKMGR